MSHEAPCLLPVPRQLEMLTGVHALGRARTIVLQSENPQDLLAAARRVQKALREQAGADWDIAAGAPAATGGGITIAVEPGQVSNAQGYHLSVDSPGITLIGHDAAGAYYAACTLAQIIEQRGAALPCLRITDWPDFPARGVMLDVSRDRVPTMATLYALVDMLSSWKVNQFQLYTEHTFAYRQHPEAWADASPVTGEEILALDAYCRERYVELVPNQNSFGHFERWLVHPRYASLSEGATPNMTLCPIDPGSMALVRSLYDELLPHFTSRMFNVGCDETQLGKGRSKSACVERGVGRVYLDYVLGVYEEVRRRGRTMQYWGDIIMQYPELIPELPKDAIALEWGYEADHPFSQHSARFAASGVPFYVCPGTATWNSLAGRTDNAVANIQNAASNGLRNGAIGLLNTDWGDRGHWQALSMSYLGFAAGAAFAWCVASAAGLDVAQALSRHAFRDDADVMGRAAYDLGNVYKAAGWVPRNASALVHALQKPLNSLPADLPKVSAEGYRRAQDAIAAALEPVQRARMRRADAEIIKDEFANTGRLLHHACRRGLLSLAGGSRGPEEERRQLTLDMLGIMQDYARLWLERSRPGGLGDSLQRLERARADYDWHTHAPFEW